MGPAAPRGDPFALHHATGLISIIALGLVCAFVGGMAAQRLRLPPLVGYLVAGIAIGPFTPGFVGDGHGFVLRVLATIERQCFVSHDDGLLLG